MSWDTGLDKSSVAYGIAAATEPRVRVIAGPGTGKSFAMKRRVAKLLEFGVAPKEVLAVTFIRPLGRAARGRFGNEGDGARIPFRVTALFRITGE